MKKYSLTICALLSAVILTACAGGASETGEAETETLPVITIETEAAEEEEKIIAAGLNDSILPSLQDITTAAENAPEY